MAKFIGTYQIEEVDSRLFKTLQDLTYIANNGEIILVPAGFITDGASIPKIFWSIIGSPFTGKYKKPALIHDYLYAIHLTSRKRVDSIFIEGMKYLGVSRIKRVLMWFAVKVGGAFVWQKCKKRYNQSNKQIK